MSMRRETAVEDEEEHMQDIGAGDVRIIRSDDGTA